MSHAGVAVLFMFVSFVLFGTVFYGALVVSGFYVGREIAQAEYRYMSDNNLGRIDSPWYSGFKPEAWNKKSVLDFMIPVIVSIIGVQIENLI